MDAINALMSYSFAEIVIILVYIVIGIKFLWSIVDWFVERFKKIFGVKTAKEKKDQEFKDTVVDMAQKIDDKEIQFTDAILTIKTMITDLKSKIDDLEKKEDMTRERIQQETRTYLIDQHKRHMAERWIDVRSLENIEMKYMYYKAAGGNSFVDDLVRDLRLLPKIPPEPGEED